MAVTNSALHPVSPNRRRRVRHKIQMPAYATFTAESQGAMLDLHEIVDISEDGIAIQCHSPLPAHKPVNLCLDLADSSDHIYTTAQVVWSNPSGRSGLHFSELSSESVFRLREWLFANVMARVADVEAEVENNAEAGIAAAHIEIPPRPSYSDTLEAVSAVQRQVEALGSDLAAVLPLIAGRAETLVRATGAAIALADADPDFMICRASSGPDAPPVGARLQVGSGFSGQCVKTGTLLRCDDTELDIRVDRENCRALGIRSILAAPVCIGGKSIGILEAFSSEPDAFSDTHSRVLERLAQSVIAAVNRAARAEDLPLPGAAAAAASASRFAPTPGSVLFASAPEAEVKPEITEEKHSGGISLPLSHLVLLVCAAITISLVLGIASAPWIQAKLHERRLSSVQTVLASSRPPTSDAPAAPALPTVETATFEQLRQMADNNDPAAENAMGLRYATGEGVKLDEREAVRWFTRAAEHGSVAAQSKLGAIYFSGRGVPQDFNQAYFWMYLARAGGDPASKMLAPSVMARLTRAQVISAEKDADQWLHQHLPTWKPSAAH
jgi:hypothetical protein